MIKDYYYIIDAHLLKAETMREQGREDERQQLYKTAEDDAENAHKRGEIDIVELVVLLACISQCKTFPALTTPI